MYLCFSFISSNIVHITEGTKTEYQGSSTGTIKSMPWDGQSDYKRAKSYYMKECVVWKHINEPGNWLKTLETVEIWASNGRNSETCERSTITRIKGRTSEEHSKVGEWRWTPFLVNLLDIWPIYYL